MNLENSIWHDFNICHLSDNRQKALISDFPRIKSDNGKAFPIVFFIPTESLSLFPR